MFLQAIAALDRVFGGDLPQGDGLAKRVQQNRDDRAKFLAEQKARTEQTSD